MRIFKEIIQEIHEQICHDVDGNCDECPKFISKRCCAETKAPKGWIKLRMEAIGNDLYINTSTIVGLSVQNGVNETLTEIYTIGAEDDPWLVEESIDKVMEKIGKA